MLFDYPFPTNVAPMEGYRDRGGVSRGGVARRPLLQCWKVGAVAALIRSVASFSIQSPHTGSTRYDSTSVKLPAAALSVEDAEMLHRFQDRGEKAVAVTIKMEAHQLPDAPSRNVVAELRGSEKPDEAGRGARWAHRLVGRWPRGDGRRRVQRRRVGSRSSHEATWTQAKAHRPRGDVDERGERRPRWPRLSRCAHQ